jgi:hypothetical protein
MKREPMQRATIRYGTLSALCIAIAIAAASALSCTRVVDLDLPDAGFFPDAAVGTGDGSDGGGGDGGGDDGGGWPDAGSIGDASIPDA